jgi:hypothetical protein
MHCAVSCGSLSGLIFMSELLRVCFVLKIVLMHRFPIRLNFSETPFTYGIYSDPRGFCPLFRRLLSFEFITVNETLGINFELEIASQAADFINQILSFLAYGGSSIVKTLDQPSFSCGGWL